MINRLSLALLLLLLVAPATAWAELRLKAEAVIADDVIRVGDLFDGAGTLARREIGPAPAPGMTATYQANHLAAIARAHGLAWQPQTADASVSVSRESAAATPLPDIAAMIADALHAHGIDGELSVILARLPAGLDGTTTVRRLEVDNGNGRFLAELTGSDPNSTIGVTGRFETIVTVPTPNRTLARGAIIGNDDVAMNEIRVAGTPADLVIDMTGIVGMAVRRTLRAGKPVLSADLTEPALVTKGSLVTMTLRAPGMVLTGTGRALADGRLGETIAIMNPRSKRTVEGIVAGADTVEVQLTRPIATSSLR